VRPQVGDHVITHVGDWDRGDIEAWDRRRGRITAEEPAYLHRKYYRYRVDLDDGRWLWLDEWQVEVIDPIALLGELAE